MYYKNKTVLYDCQLNKIKNLQICDYFSQSLLLYETHIQAISTFEDPCPNDCDPPNQDLYDYTCHLEDISTVTIVFGVLLLLGTLISIIPQNIKLFITKSTDGISYTMLIFALYDQQFSNLNYITAYFPRLMACNNDINKCLQNIIPLFQAVFLFICYFILTAQYLYYKFRECKKEGTKNSIRTFQTQFWLYIGFSIFMILSVIPAVIPGFYYSTCNSVYEGFSATYGFISVLFGLVEWIPQIYLTYKLKHIGSMSLISFSIQTLGCFVSLLVTFLSYSPWYACTSWIMSCILHTILLVELFYYYCKNRKYEKLEDQQSDVQQLMDIQEGQEE